MAETHYDALQKSNFPILCITILLKLNSKQIFSDKKSFANNRKKWSYLALEAYEYLTYNSLNRWFMTKVMPLSILKSHMHDS